MVSFSEKHQNKKKRNLRYPISAQKLEVRHLSETNLPIKTICITGPEELSEGLNFRVRTNALHHPFPKSYRLTSI
jgi:hypothetical protein